MGDEELKWKNVTTDVACRPVLSSEFLHVAQKAVREETGTVGVPLVVVVDAYPFSVRVAVLADENGARSLAFHVAAVVMCHNCWSVCSPLN